MTSRAVGLGRLTAPSGDRIAEPVGAPRINDRPMPDLTAGLCRTHPEPDLWFTTPPKGGDRHAGVVARARIERAQAICHLCPVKADCLSWALTYGEPYGVWGGMAEDTRARLRQRGGLR